MSLLKRNRWISVGVCAALVLVAWSGASARTITIQWSQLTPPDVQGYRAYWGTASQSYGTPVELGLPTPSSGIYSSQITAPDSDVYVALVAYNGEGDSGFSNEELYPLAAPPPPPPPPPTGASAAVIGFALVDATNLQVLDDDFRDGDVISLTTHGDCTAIQILVNAYLDQSQSPGSVRLEFGGQAPAACDQPFTTHDDGPPYFFKQNGCAPELLDVGAHTFTATPFDDNACAGAAGTPVSVDFEVTTDPVGGDPVPPVPPEPLGMPGRPELVF